MDFARVQQLFSAILIFMIYPEDVCAGAVMQVQFVSFDNKNKELSDGSCCDGWGWCLSNCDPYFVVCIDETEKSTSVWECLYYNAISVSYDDKQSVKFGSRMGDITNPVTVAFNEWPGGVRLKIAVRDHDDHNSDDDMDLVWKDFTMRPSRTLEEAQYIEHTLIGKRTATTPSSLTLKYRVYCLEDFYGPGCNIECHSLNTTDAHYFCNPSTGEKVCYPGWRDISTNCTTPTDECSNVTCDNGGTCVDSHLNFTCLCAGSYHGVTCQFHPCDNITCKNNGQCVDEGECSCPPDYSGDFCEKSPLKEEASEAFPVWAIIVLFSIAGFILVDVMSVIIYRRCRKKDSMREPLVQDNPCYDSHNDVPVTEPPSVYSLENIQSQLDNSTKQEAFRDYGLNPSTTEQQGSVFPGVVSPSSPDKDLKPPLEKR